MLSDTELVNFLGRLGAAQLEMTLALRTALFGRSIGEDFFRWISTPDGHAALEEAMGRLGYSYRVSLTGASDLLVSPNLCESFPVPGVSETFLFQSCMLADCGVVEMTDRFRDLFPNETIFSRPGVLMSAHPLQCASRYGDIVLALGTRPYSDRQTLMALLADANVSASSHLHTTRSNLFCMVARHGDPCIVEAWSDAGWHLDAHATDDAGVDRKLFDPGCLVIAPVGTREKKKKPD